MVFQQIIKNISAYRYYRTDQSGIINRYLAEGENWNTHLLNSKKYILNSLPANKLESVAILGSGWLLDVPIDELLTHTKILVLYDICHPNQILNKYKNHKSIVFVKADLTNNLIEGALKSKTVNDFLILVRELKPLSYLNEYSFVVSLNVLNQLDILLCDLLKRKFIVSDEDLIEIRKIIQTMHLQSLPIGKSCLITDYEEVNYINSMHDIKGIPLIYSNLDNLANKQEWLWNFDTHKKYRKNLNTTFKVIAGNY